MSGYWISSDEPMYPLFDFDSVQRNRATQLLAALLTYEIPGASLPASEITKLQLSEPEWVDPCLARRSARLGRRGRTLAQLMGAA